MDKETLRMHRLLRGFSQKKLGEMIGLTSASINRMEKGHQPISAENEKKLRSALNVNGHLDAARMIANMIDRFSNLSKRQQKLLYKEIMFKLDLMDEELKILRAA